ncbi:MAG: hypothetical protein II115_01830 [Prevotella sp.]|nr:hypothetical protein [Prevotella sp.]
MEIKEKWTSKYFFSFFCDSDFDLQWRSPERVLGGLESAAESWLSDDESKTNSKGLIRAPRHCESIFRQLL